MHGTRNWLDFTVYPLTVSALGTLMFHFQPARFGIYEGIGTVRYWSLNFPVYVLLLHGRDLRLRKISLDCSLSKQVL